MSEMVLPPGQPARREFEMLLPVGVTDAEGFVQRQAGLRKMTGNEEALLYDPGLGNAQLVTELLNSCLTRLGTIQPVTSEILRQMYTLDRNYLMVELRRITLGEQLPVLYTCPHCGRQVAYHENLGQIPVKRLGEGETAPALAVELEDGFVDREGNLHKTVTLRYPTGADEEFVTPLVAKNPLQAQDAFLLRCVTSFGTLPKAALEAYGVKILRELSLGDRQRLLRALNEDAPGVDFHRAVPCESCHNTFDAVLDVTHFFALS